MVSHAAGPFQGGKSDVIRYNHSLLHISTLAPRLHYSIPSAGIVVSHESVGNNRGRGLSTTPWCATPPISPILDPVKEEGEGIPPVENICPPRAAFFDVDGTIVKSNVVSAFLTWRVAELDFISRCLWLPTFAARVIVYLILDRIDRSRFNRVFYRSYAGRQVSMKGNVAALVYDRYLKPK